MADRFIALDYTGRADGQVFDTTRSSDVPPGTKGNFNPSVVKLGSGQLIPGLDKFLADKQPGNYEVTLQPAEAFGNKDSKQLKLVPISSFGKDAKGLEPGMSVRFGEQQGIIKSISGGRVVVDFNHPLAGKVVEYKLQVIEDVTDPKRKVEAMLQAFLGVPLPVEMKDGKAVVGLPKGFPAEGLVKELEKQTGVSVEAKEIDMGEHKAHDHAGHDHSHDGHDHSHEGHDHKH